MLPVARAWKYNTAVSEYFVETSTKQTIRQTELQKQQELVDVSDSRQHKVSKPNPRSIFLTLDLFLVTIGLG